MNARKLVLCVLTVLSTIFAHPNCEPSKNNVQHLVCTPGEDDYVLEKGLVSDNNRTTKVTLRGCRITVLGHEAFRGLPLLKQIDLSNNKLTELSLDTLDDPRRLTHLNVSYNFIMNIPVGVFDKVTNLLSLDLKSNQIGDLDTGVFDTIQRLKYLDLSNNAFQGNILNDSILNKNPRIEFIDFSGNDMSGASDLLLMALATIEVLNLDRCMLTNVPEFAVSMQLNTMKKLSMSFNQISKLDDSRTFVPLSNLEKLDISWNIMESVHQDIFKPLTKLKIIVLRNNKLLQIPETLFLNMRMLSNIDLSNNLITFIPVNAFRGTGLKNLNLANNRFTYLTDNFCLELRNTGARLQKFYFNQNPWQCKCLLDIVNEVEKFGIEYNTAKYDGTQPVCVTHEFTCKRHDNFNEIYVDLYKKLVLKNSSSS